MLLRFLVRNRIMNMHNGLMFKKLVDNRHRRSFTHIVRVWLESKSPNRDPFSLEIVSKVGQNFFCKQYPLIFIHPFDRIQDFEIVFELISRFNESADVFWKAGTTITGSGEQKLHSNARIGTDSFANHIDIGTDTLADLACLAAALIYALAGVYGRRFNRMGISPMLTATGQVTAATIILLPVALVIERPWTLATPSPPVWGAVIGIAVLSTALAYVFYFRILATAGATNLLLVTFLIPVSALLLGTMVLREPLVASELAGMALIGAGLAAIDGRLPRFVGARLWLPARPSSEVPIEHDRERPRGNAEGEPKAARAPIGT